MLVCCMMAQMYGGSEKERTLPFLVNLVSLQLCSRTGRIFWSRTHAATQNNATSFFPQFFKKQCDRHRQNQSQIAVFPIKFQKWEEIPGKNSLVLGITVSRSVVSSFMQISLAYHDLSLALFGYYCLIFSCDRHAGFPVFLKNTLSQDYK